MVTQVETLWTIDDGHGNIDHRKRRHDMRGVVFLSYDVL